MRKLIKKGLLATAFIVGSLGTVQAQSGQIMLHIDDDCSLFSDVTANPIRFVVRGDDNLAFQNFARVDYVRNAMVRNDTGSGQMHSFDVPLFELVYAQKLGTPVPVLNYRVIQPPPFFRVGIVYSDGRSIGAGNSAVINVAEHNGVLNASIDGKNVFQLGDLYCRLLEEDTNNDGAPEVVINCRCMEPFR